ncbi:hypothetical protein HN011_002757 [Eciton burchellii]|nr:hypothetical protein HN011_002757 [Eciton burchellii]
MFAIAGLIVVCMALNAYGLPTVQIVGGADAPDGLYTYQASLRRSNNRKHFCGGAVISKNHIITAAHCLVILDDPSEMYIAVGSNRLDAPHAVHEVTSFVIHPDYNMLQRVHDIGLIHLSKKMEFNEHVQPIALPNFDYDYDNFPLIVTGWGRLWADGRTPNSLQEIRVKGYSQKKCNRQYEIIQKSHICTITKEGEGMCNGDSGGPLVADNALVGLVSFGVVPCGSGSPDVYTRVFYYRSWIKSHTGM